MKQAIYRNIAIVSAIFIITLSIMLIINYFQVKEVSPLQTQVVETLKQINDQNSNNTELQEQIRQLDLMARKAYFLSMDHLMNGVYLLLGMLAVFIVCTRMYFTHYKDIPDKDIDPIDEWAIKTRARKYVGFAAVSLVALAMVFIVYSIPFMKASENIATAEKQENLAIVTESKKQEVLNTISETTNESSTKTTKEENTKKIVAEQPPVKVEEKSPEIEKAEPKNTEEEKEIKIIKEDVKPVEKVVPKINSNAFRGNNSNGITNAKNIPLKWDLPNGNNIEWRTELSLPGQSSPIINGNRVFITGANEKSRELLCYDLITGEQLWALTAANIPGSPSQVPKTTPDTGLASSSAATNGKQVCAIFATGDLICANMEGKLLWAKNLGVPDNHYGYASSLLIHNNQLFIQYDNVNTHKVLALNTETGDEIWSKDRDDKIAWCSPTIAYVNNIPQLVLMGNPSITAYNINNGDQLWKVKCLSGEVGASACSSNGIIYGASEYAVMVAINGSDGSVLWESMDYLPEASSPVATANDIYLATSYGVVASFDTKTGSLKKEHETNEEFYSSPMMVEGKIYLFSNAGKMHIFSANDEFALLDSFETGEKTFATPAFTDGRIVVRTDKSIYCVKAN